MKSLTFYDVKGKKKFSTTSYTVSKTKNGRKIAKAKAPSGITATLFLPNDFKQ